MKNLTVPDGVPLAPLRCATSWTDAPKSAVAVLELVSIVGGTQVSKLPPAKSLRVESTDWDERVSAMKLLKQGAVPPKRSSRSMPPSKNDSAGMSLSEPGSPLSSKVHDGLS